MILAKYKKPLGIWLLFWCFWLLVTGTDYIGQGRHSPFLWPNVWGVIDWLVSTAAFVALWLAADHEFRRDLPKRDRFHDIVMLGYFLGRGLALIALLGMIGAVRVSLYRGDLQINFASFRPSWREPSILEVPFLFCMVASAPAIVAVLFGAISILFRKYDKADQITPR